MMNEGKILAGRYELVEKIGEGGMARVFRGRDNLLKRTVAIKVLKDQMTGDAAFVRRFQREAQSAAALSHPHIVNIYDVGEEEGLYFMVMEYVDGKNLKEHIRSKGRLPMHEAIEITRQIAEALAHAHESDLIHRDIKPQNILFSRDGKVKVTDFGIAIAGDGATLTVGDQIIGSVQYFSPEQARGGLAVKQSDLYSLGIMLYEMITGTLPFSGESPVAVAMKHIQEEIVRPRQIVSSIPESLENVIMKAVEKDMAERYGSAEELLEDLFYVEQKGTPRAAKPRKTLNDSDDDSGTVLRPTKKDQFDKNNRSYGWVKYVVLLLILGLLGGGAFYVLNSYLFLPEVEVPDVRDMTQSEAAQTLRVTELEVADEVFYIADDIIQVGNVVRTEPEAGTMVRANREIILYVSKGPDYIITPNLSGRTESEARVILRELDLEMEVVQEYNEAVQTGRIFRQSPGESFRSYPGDTVIVYISLGRGPFEIINLIGYPEEEAVAWLEDHELRPRLRVEFSFEPTGTVIQQQPEPGEMVLPNQSVDLVISN